MSRSGSKCLTVSIARPILDEYEALIKDAGYRVGLVVPSSVAALPLCVNEERGLTVVAKTAGSTLSVMLLDGGRVRLVRCLDLALSGEEARCLRRAHGNAAPAANVGVRGRPDWAADQPAAVVRVRTPTRTSLGARRSAS